VNGGVAFLELTRGAAGTHWHPHLHIIWEGKYLPQEQVSKRWKELTGDSWIVDLRPIGDVERAASYVAKYASKSIPKSIWDNQENLIEVIQVLEGRRTFNTFGSWRKIPLCKIPPIQDGWERVCPLTWAIRAARSGSNDARRLLNMLNSQIDVFDILITPDSS